MNSRCTYSGLEVGNLLIGEGIRLGNDGDQVDLGVQASHDLDVQRLQRVASGLNKEDASVNAVVDDIHAVYLVFGIKVCVVTLLDVVHNGAPRLVVVDKVAESRGINNSQAKANSSFLNIGADGLDLDGLGDNIKARTLALSGRVERGVEERVHQGRLSQAGFTYPPSTISAARFHCSGSSHQVLISSLTDYHDIKVEALSHTLAMPLVGQVCETDISGQLSSNDISGIMNGSWLGWDCRSRVRSMNIVSRGRGFRLAGRW